MMSYGLKNESTAVQMYTKYMHFIGHKVTTYRSGLVVDQRCFWRGASPGRKVFDRFVTERCSKHPTSLFGGSEMPREENQKRDPKELCDEESFYIEQREGKFLLKKSHMHYKQAQGQMGLAGADWSDFIVRAVGSFFWWGGGAEIEIWRLESSAAGARPYTGNFLVKSL